MSPIYCSQCGTGLPPRSVYCPKCGAPAPGAPATTSAQPTQSGRRTAQTRRNVVLPILLAGALLLLAGGVYLAVGQDRAPATASTTASPTVSTTASTIPDEHGADGLPYPEVARITPAEAKARVDSGQAILVDVRSQGEYDTQHAQGARLLSLADLEARYRELPQNADIITYCT